MATAADLHLLGIGYRHVRGGEDSFERAGQRIRKSGKDAAGSVSAVDGALDHLRVRFSSILSPAAAVDAALAAMAVTAFAVVGAMGAAIKTSIEFEAKLVGVGKTANIEGAALRSLGDDIDALSRRIPVASRELLEIAESAGSLGVEGAANILKFTETVAKLGRSSDLAGDEGATALARILNVTGESVSTVDSLASVIVSLGNSFAATESEIAHHAGEVAKATAVYEIGSAASAAMAATLASFGVRAELAGSAVGRSFRVIENAVKSGGADMAALAKVSGASAEDIRRAWSRGPVEAFNLFLQGVGKIQASGGNVAQALETVKLEGEEVLKVIPVLATQFESLAKAQEIAAREAANPTALNTEFARAATTLKTELDLLRNIITSLQKSIGDQLAPVVKQIVTDVRLWLSANRDAARSLGEDLADALRAAAQAVAFLIRHFDEIKAIAIGLIALQLTSWLHGVGVAVVGQVTAWRTWVAVKINAVRSEAAYAAELAATTRGVASYSVAAARGTTAAAGQASAARAAAVAHAAAAVAAEGATAATAGLTVAQRAQATSAGLAARAEQAFAGAAGQSLAMLGPNVTATGALTAAKRSLMVMLAALYNAWRSYVGGALLPAGTTTVALTGATRALTAGMAGQAALVGTVTGQARLLTAGNVAAAASQRLLAAGSAATLPALTGQTLALTGATAATTGLTLAQRALIVVTAALRAAWQAFTAWLVANPITAVAVALGALAAALYLAWKRNKEAREESERYHAELRAGRPAIEGMTRAHDEYSERIELETRRLRELSAANQDATARLAAAEPVLKRMQAALESGDNAGFRAAAEDAKRLGLAVSSVGKESTFELVTKQVEALRAALVANKEQVKASTDEISVAQQKLRDNVSEAIEVERRSMLVQRARAAELQQQALEAEIALQRMMEAGPGRHEGSELAFGAAIGRMVSKLKDLKQAAVDASVGLEQIGLRMDELRGYAEERAQELLGQGSYDQAAGLLRQAGVEEREIQRRIEMTRIFAEATSNLTRKQEENNRVNDFGKDKADAAKKRFEQLRQEMTAVIAGLALMTAAWADGDEAVAKANRQLLISTAVAQRSAEELDKHEDEIRAWVTAQVDGERKLGQAQTKSAITQRIKDLDAQNKAYRDNVRTIDTVILRQEEEARVRAATTGAIEGERLELERLANQENQSLAENVYLASADALKLQIAELERLAIARQKGGVLAEAAQAEEEEFQRSLLEAISKVLPEYRGELEKLLKRFRDLNKEKADFDAASPIRQIVLDADFAVQANAIADLGSERARQIETQYLELLRNLGQGSVTEGKRVFDRLAAQFGYTVDQVKAALGKLADVQLAGSVRGAGKTPLEVYRQERKEIERLMSSSAQDVRISTEDGNAAINDLTNQFWAEQLGSWSSALGYLANQFGGFFDYLAQAANAIQGGLSFGSSVGNIAQGLGASSSTAATWGSYAGAFAAYLAVVQIAVDAFNSHIESRRSRWYDNAAVLVHIGDQWDYSANALDHQATSAARQISSSIDAIAAAIGGEVIDFAPIEVQVQRSGKRFKAFVANELIGVFDSMEEATSAAIVRAFGSTSTVIRGLSDLVRQGMSELVGSLQGVSRGVSADEMTEFLVKLREISELNWSDSARQVAEATRRYSEMLDTLSRMNSLSPAVQQGFDGIVAAFVSSYRAWQDSVTGRQRTAAEQLEAQRQDARLVEANKALTIADLKLKALETEARIAELEARRTLARDRIDLERTELEGMGAALRLRQELAAQEMADLERFMAAKAAGVGAEADLNQQQLAVLYARLGAIREIIAGLEGLGTIDIDSIRLPGGGGGGGRRKQDAETLRGMLDDVALSKLSDYSRAMSDINKKWDDAIPLAHGNAALLEEIAAARRAETEALRDQAAEDLYARLRDYERGPLDDGSPQSQLAAIQEEAQALRDEFMVTATELGFGADRIARGLDRITAAERARIAALTEQVIDGLGLPLEQLRDRGVQLGQTLAFLRDRVEDGTISAERFNEVFAQMSRQAEAELLGMAAGLLEQMGNDQQAAEIKARLEQANFHLQVAQLNMLFETYRGLGLLSAEVVGIVQGALDWINDPANHPRFDPADYLPDTAGGGGFGGSDASSAANDDQRRRQEILDQIREWNQLGESDVSSGLRDLNEVLVGMQADARRLGISLADLMSAHANAVEDFWDRTLSPYEEGDSDRLLDRVAEINRVFDEMIAAAQQYGGDQARIEAARLREIERFWDEALEPIRQLQERFQLGELGGLSPEQRLLQAQARFEELARRALAGDAAAIQDLPAAVDALLEQQQAFSGTGPAYQALVATIQGVLAQILALGGGTPALNRPRALGASELAGAPPPILAFPNVVRPEAPRPVPLPGGVSNAPLQSDDAANDRVDRLVDAMESDTDRRRDDRREMDELRREIDRLLEVVSEQNDQVAELAADVRNLTALVESQERRRMVS